MPADQELLEILTVVEPGDFTLYGFDQQAIVVPRLGRSKNILLDCVKRRDVQFGSGNLAEAAAPVDLGNPYPALDRLVERVNCLADNDIDRAS